jgi:capsular polysaccharide biosynthesis protein
VIYGQGRRKFFNPAAHCDQTKRAWIEYDEVALRSSFVGCHFFGHWLGDDCATHLLAEQAGTVMSMPTPPWPDRASYLALLGQAYEELDRACVKRLVLFHDISQNACKVQRLRKLRARLANETVSSAAADVVYLMRGSGGRPRSLINEAEIVDELTRRGVRILRAETLPVPQMIAELCGARIIIGVEGSQLSHALLTLRDEGALLTIQPPDRFFNSHMDWARPLNMRYGIVVGEARPSGFYLPIDDLLRTIDLLDAN